MRGLKFEKFNQDNMGIIFLVMEVTNFIVDIEKVCHNKLELDGIPSCRPPEFQKK